MKVGALLQKRQEQWGELERLCVTVGAVGRRPPAETVHRFARLYRDACADLALADSYQLPQETVEFLHRLVARSHNALYRSRGFSFDKWSEMLLKTVPRACFRDGCVHTAFLIFWGFFLFSAYLGYHDDDFVSRVCGDEHVESVKQMYSEFDTRPFSTNFTMACFYVYNNAGIGLQCFAWSVLFLPGLFTIAYNAVFLGTTFGVMFRPEMGEAGVNFRNFVTAHGPFELTAIVLSAAAGLRIGMGWVRTNGVDRFDSIVRAGSVAMPIAGAATVLFVLAALIEGFVSPSGLPWAFKGIVAILSSLGLLVYFVVLGFPRGGPRET